MIGLTGYLTPERVPPCHVYLDGLPKSHVVEAHTEEGWIVRCMLDGEGNVQLLGGEIATEKLFGTVTAVLVETEE